jgi:hypothetical protein
MAGTDTPKCFAIDVPTGSLIGGVNILEESRDAANRLASIASGWAHRDHRVIAARSTWNPRGDLLPISALSELTRLSVRGSDVTDQGVKQLSVLRKLKFINLHATRVTDQSLFVLAKMGTLEEIDVGYNQNITDAGIRALGTLNTLRSVNFNSGKVSPEAARWIQTRLKK